MPGKHQENRSFASLLSKVIIARAFFIALLLGTVLTLANQYGAIFGHDAVHVLQLALVYLTPFVVITISQVLGLRHATLVARSPRSSGHPDPGFFATAMSHGIPRRALLVALVIGIVNTFIVASNTLMTTGSLLNLPTALIVQTFGLPMLFGLLSQTISYRREMSAIGQRLQSTPQTRSI